MSAARAGIARFHRRAAPQLVLNAEAPLVDGWLRNKELEAVQLWLRSEILDQQITLRDKSVRKINPVGIERKNALLEHLRHGKIGRNARSGRLVIGWQELIVELAGSAANSQFAALRRRPRKAHARGEILQ